MSIALSPQSNTTIRLVQYHDLEAVERLFLEAAALADPDTVAEVGKQLQQIRRWYAPLKFLSFFPNPLQDAFCTYVAEQNHRICGAIQVSPFNRTRSTWRVDRVAVDAEVQSQGVGSQLLRYCFEAIWQARTWVLEVNVNDKTTLALYRQNGFQPLAQMAYWTIAPELLQALAEREVDLPNLLPISNADAPLLYQLDTVSMPPLMRQVFDRHVHDFKTSLPGAMVKGMGERLNQIETSNGYVFEPQRKAAIGYFQVQACQDGTQPHTAQITVHPAYTWLYPELASKMAQVVQPLPPQSLHVASADYQPEREEYLEHIGASRFAHTLMMSRSVWHKVRESKSVRLEGLQLSEVLQGFQPVQKPVPGRITFKHTKLAARMGRPTPSDRAETSSDRF